MRRGFSFSWRQRKVSSHTKAEISLAKGKSTLNDDDICEPTPAEYVGEVAKGFLAVLGAVAEGIPVPGVGAVVKLGIKLIETCENGYATLDQAEELRLRIKVLLSVLIDKLKGMKAEEVPEALKEDVDILRRNFAYIAKKLGGVASQNPLLVIFFKSLNEDKIRKCVNCLNNSMERFNLAYNMDHAIAHDRLEKEILTFHANQGNSLQRIQILIEERLPKVTAMQPRSRTTVPANTDNFHGRDALVAKFVRILTASVSTSHKNPRVCLLGSGGMGKTCVARAVMAHPDLKKHFADGNRVWVPCVKATSVSLLLDTLYSSLGTTRNTGNVHQDILSDLQSSEPMILLLDNFETPWNTDGGRSEIEQIIRDIHQIPHLTLFLTMRASNPPCTDIHWHMVNLRGVDPNAAHRIYSDIDLIGSTDPDLPELLEVVGHMPLAITLMANLGRLLGLSAKKLVTEYNKKGTTMLGHGSDAEHSMDICIGLSVNSPCMKRHPAAFQLLAKLAMLPIGTTYDMLVNYWASSSSNLTGELGVLREVSLVDKRESTFFVLPVIRRYILNPTRFPDNVRGCMVRSACVFLAGRKSFPGDSLYKKHIEELYVEEGNLQEILLDTTIGTPDLIDALLILARYQRSMRPRTDVIEHAMNLVHGMEDAASLVGSVVDCYGHILFSSNRYAEAMQQFKRAHEIFSSIPDRKQAARSLLNQVDLYSRLDGRSFAEDHALIAQAEAEFEAVDDAHGIALCLYYIGRLYWQHSPKSPSTDDLLLSPIKPLESARTIFEELEDPLYLAHCSLELANTFLWAKQYKAAEKWAMSAMQEYEEIGYYEPRAAQMLSWVYSVNGDYDNAFKTLTQRLERSEAYGASSDTADALEEMGRVLAKMGKKRDARRAFEESMRYYSSVNFKSQVDGLIRCRFFLRKLEDPGLVPSEEEESELLGMYPFDVEDIL